MKFLVSILPVSLLVAYSQVVVKLRSSQLIDNEKTFNLLDKLIIYFSDPLIVSAYLAALLSSLAWLFVITKIPLSIGYPVYIGMTFIIVILSSHLFLHEDLSLSKIIAMTLILAGITVGTLK
jgi:multidrug transporter EmrE-like cation transporter